MTHVYVLHRNLPYEFGVVVGVFLTKEAAVAHVTGMDPDDEYAILRYTPSDDILSQDEKEVWSMHRGEVKSSD